MSSPSSTVPFNVSLSNGIEVFLGVKLTSTFGELLEQAQKHFSLPVTKNHSLVVFREGETSNLCLDDTIESIDEREALIVPMANATLLETIALEPCKEELETADLTEKDHEGRGFLHFAARGMPDAIEFLLSKKVDINQRDSNWRVPLHYAARFGCVTSLNLLKKNGASVTAVDKHGSNFLHYLCQSPFAADESFRPYFDWAFANGLHPFATGENGNTPAHYAAAAGNEIALQIFFDKFQIPLDFVNSAGDSCLHLAVRSFQVKIVQLLKKYGADIYCSNNLRELPADFALANRGSGMMGLLADAESIAAFFMAPDVWVAVKKGDIPTVLERLEEKRKRKRSSKKRSSSKETTKKEDSSESSEKSTPRKKRRKKKSKTSVNTQQLLNAVTMWAAARMDIKLLDALLDHPKANASYTTDTNLSILNILCRCSDSTIFNDPLYVKVLEKAVAKGDNVNTRPDSGNTCIHVAALNSNAPAIKFLLDNNAFLNSVNSISMSELHYATISGSEEIVKQLLTAGSDPNILLRSGKTCAEFAGLIGQLKIREIIKSYDSKTDSKVFRPNIAKVTFVRASGLLAKDDNGLSDPYLSFVHHCDADVYQDKTEVMRGNLEPVWDATFELVISTNFVVYRDIPINVYDHDDGEGVDDLIGRGVVVMDTRKEEQVIMLPLQDASGPAGEVEIRIEYYQKSDSHVASVLKKQYKKYDAAQATKELLKAAKQKSVGKAKASLGYKPKYPVMIIPGFASSALECWQAEKSAWIRERIWVDPFKIGHTVVGQTFVNKLTGYDSKDLSASERTWLKHMLCAEDGFSDPEGIVVRPVPGLHATDYLADNPLARAPSYVFGHLISELCDVGYTSKNLDAATYDWRLPPQKLEERDGYFTELKYKIEFMRTRNKEKVVLMAHSMGNRCTQYFLSWANKNHPGWIDKNVHAFLALGPPFLGASKTIRAVVSGDCCGLEAFLTLEEGRAMHRKLGSVPWLLPVHEEYFPDIVTRVRKASSISVDRRGSGLFSGFRRKKDTLTDLGASKHRAEFEEHNTESILDSDAPTTWEFYKKFYADDDVYLKKSPGESLPEVLKPPPVQNLWVVIGTNLQTEVSYYYKPTKGPDGADRLVLDSSADSYSGKKIAGINPRGLKIHGGTGYETRTTYQPSTRVNKSGDGTVPYCSLNYAESAWRQYVAQNKLPIKIQTFELDGVEHREMLNDGTCFNCIIDLICNKPLG